jgi:hypothetical protein
LAALFRSNWISAPPPMLPFGLALPARCPAREAGTAWPFSRPCCPSSSSRQPDFRSSSGLVSRNLPARNLRQPFLRLGLAEAVRGRPQFFLHFRQGQGFQIVLRTGLGSRLRFGALGWSALGSVVGISSCAFSWGYSTSSSGFPACLRRICRCIACARSACP